jgi:hypothetical protein
LLPPDFFDSNRHVAGDVGPTQLNGTSNEAA